MSTPARGQNFSESFGLFLLSDDEKPRVEYGKWLIFTLWRGKDLGPAPAQSLARSLPNYGDLVPIASGKDGMCTGSGGAALHPSGRFGYINGFGSPGLICAFAYDAATNQVSRIANVTTGAEPRGMAFEPAGRYLYVVSGSARAVHAYAVSPESGALVAVAGSPFPTGGLLPNAVVAHPNGRYLYVTNYQSNTGDAGTIAAFSIDRATGALLPLAGSPYKIVDGNVSESVTALAMTPDGRTLYAGGNAITAFAVDGTTGALTRKSRAGPFTGGLAVEPTGRYLFATDLGNNAVARFAIAVDGSLTGTGSTPLAADARGIVAVADVLYVASAGAGATFGFRIAPETGQLTPLATSPFVSGPKPNALAALAPLPRSIQLDAGDAFVVTLSPYGGTPPYATGVASGSLPPGLTLNSATSVISGTATVPGVYDFTLNLVDGTGSATIAQRSITVAGSALSTAVEFYNASLDHYFITYVADEIAKLDAGTVIKGWARTGKSFAVYTTVQAASSPVCRYYIPPNLGDSHFFGRGTAECNATGQKNPSFVLEDPAFMHMVLPTAGVCPAGTTNVYRVFSNRPDANHRYMNDAAVRNEMVAKGWLAEGDGPDLVVMCAPQ